ncbi:uncharacterized protein BX664DRAFT_327674 [Halteromyces radiatus]|uniref:uncharacterized protein n=1 Tax=Halteromyces radiatus TaxID=101107 RepID=UPI0022204444|nr:uncharacterized protein BX664DRAFT_327674 [Halteromyces radiatus]KAI8092598.1 hypothetical protein BX664DRAFT_327674 [Halteromyces radiatus]
METKRLYIGNLDPSVDEYAVMKLFEPYGKIIVFEYMFYLHGPKKGQPRGYCFLEYENKKDALTAISALNGKKIKGRTLVVSSANKNTSSSDNSNRHHRSTIHRPTSFSLLRNQKMSQPASTDAKILAIEQKLAALQKPKQSTSPVCPDTQPTTSQRQSTASSSSSSSLLLSSSSSSSSSSCRPSRYRPY